MIGDAVLYAASRATHNALENVSRRITWTAIAAAFFIATLVLALIAAYLIVEPRFGSLQAVAAIGAGCLLAGLLALSVPVMVDRVVAWRQTRTSPMQAAMVAVDEEAKEAVDYFGALQVVATAFMFGLGAARRLKR